MTGVSLERLADTLYPKPEPKNGTAYGTVESINADGSYQVKLNASATTTRCAKLCDADVGDRVLVLIQANGHCAAMGRVGGDGLGRFLPKPDILYYDATGTSGTATLSKSAAGYDHLRIYYRHSSDNVYSSVDVYAPNGKLVLLPIVEATSNAAWIVGRLVQISGTSISTHDDWYGEQNATTGASYNHANYINIVRVEAWNEA